MGSRRDYDKFHVDYLDDYPDIKIPYESSLVNV